MTINPQTKNLIQDYKEWHKSLQPKEEVPKIHVDEVASKVAAIYEKLRNVLDYRDEHLLRKTAIERMIKRRFFLRKTGGEIAQSLVMELIRGGHFQNDTIEESKINETQQIINKYIFILNNAPYDENNKKERLLNWILEIAACEIEAGIAPPLKENALINYMSSIMQERIKIQGKIISQGDISEEDKSIQIFIACQQAMLRLDPSLISFNLLQKIIPNWKNPSPELLSQITQRIFGIRSRVEKDFSHPLAQKFYQICERYDTAYLIVSDIISDDPLKAESAVENPIILENKIREAYEKRFKNSKIKVKRAAVFSTLSIFLSKVLVVFAIEVPFDIKVTGQFNILTLALSILIPPILMFYLVSTIKTPSEKNESKVLLEVMDIIYGEKKEGIYEIKSRKKRGAALNAFLTIFYLASFLLSFGLIIKALQAAKFGVLSQIIFVIFISLISYAGVRLRQRAQELNIEKEKEGIIKFLMDFFSLPVIRLGGWMSRQWTKYNILLVIFNLLLEMPFQFFVEFLEQWRYFLKEKKEEIR